MTMTLIEFLELRIAEEREVERRWQEMLNDEASDELLIVILPEELSW